MTKRQRANLAAQWLFGSTFAISFLLNVVNFMAPYWGQDRDPNQALVLGIVAGLAGAAFGLTPTWSGKSEDRERDSRGDAE